LMPNVYANNTRRARSDVQNSFQVQFLSFSMLPAINTKCQHCHHRRIRNSSRFNSKLDTTIVYQHAIICMSRPLGPKGCLAATNNQIMSTTIDRVTSDSRLQCHSFRTFVVKEKNLKIQHHHHQRQLLLHVLLARDAFVRTNRALLL